jgi:hypothetical protein
MIEQHVTNLELSKILKELGLKQESLFYWTKPAQLDVYGLSFILDMFSLNEKHYGVLYSAFLASELMEILPNKIDTENHPFNIFSFNLKTSVIVDVKEYKMSRIFLVNYYCDTAQPESEHNFLSEKLMKHNIYDTNLCNTLAKTIIYLYENGYIKNE